MQHLYNIYAFCRHSDDLADEVGDTERSRVLLAEWREQLRACYNSRPDHPIMIALQDTVSRFSIPMEPFEDLISAFEQDCAVSRYETYAEIADYCKRSANPVGRLFLMLFGYDDADRFKQSDQICTLIQLANFWQDITLDFAKSRVYIPQEDLRRFDCTEDQIADRCFSPEFANLIRFEVDRTASLFQAGAKLPSTVTRKTGVDIELFRQGGEIASALGHSEERL